MTPKTVGLIGYGKINKSLHERIAESEGMEVSYIYDVADIDPNVDDDAETVKRNDIGKIDVDLVIEAAVREVVEELGERVLRASDLFSLSTTAFADPDLTGRLTDACAANGTRLYVPHGAILGTDGLQDARDALDDIYIETRKNPANIDFSFTDIDGEIDEETVLYSGSTRGICEEFPRNVNSHATVALAGLGFDKTKSTLIADPTTTEATHQITAEGDGTRLQVERVSAIEGVTGDYTLYSIWGSVQRAIKEKPGIVVL